MCVRGRCRTINPEENLVTRLVALERDMIERLDIYGAWRFGGFSTFTGGHAFFHRKVFDELGLFDEDILVEDIDLSVKLHAAGYEIAVVPGIQSWEEAPTSWRSLLHQRKRWTRGWIQIWRRHAPSILWQRKAKLLKRIDILISLTCSVTAGPLIALVPLLLLSFLGMHTSYIPAAISFKLWVLVVSTPSVMTLITWLLDKDEPKRTDWRNLLLSPLLVPYTIFMFGVSWICLMDEFVLDWPFGYVKTPRAADLNGGDGRKMSPEGTYDPPGAVTCLSESVDKRRIAAAEP
jgi:cellulose synthase/poly-beta-1,6-N-acetylglucosamine synthase-like glycosyltransferase